MMNWGCDVKAVEVKRSSNSLSGSVNNTLLTDRKAANKAVSS